MKKKNSIRVSFLMNLLLTTSSFVFPVITFPYASRILHPAGMGKVAFAASIISYFSIFAQLGVPTYGIRVCARLRENKELLSRAAQELLIINLITSSIIYIILGLCILYFDRFYENKELLIITSTSILLNTLGMEWLYKSLEQYTYITVRSLVFKAASLFLLFLFIKTSNDVILYGCITIFASSASNLLNFLNLKRYIFIKPVGRYNLKKHFKPICIFFAVACATTIYTNLDTVMLGFMVSDEMVGYYNTAVKIKTVLVSVVTSLGTVLLPRTSYYIQNKLYREFNDIKNKALSVVVVLSIPLTVFFIVYADCSILLLAGEDFILAVRPMQIIMLTLPIIGISSLFAYEVLVPWGKENIFLYSVAGGALTDLILNLIFIPRLQALGASIATLIAEIVVLAVITLYLRQAVYVSFKAIEIVKVCLSSGIAIVAAYFATGFILVALFKIIAAGILFIGCYSFLLFLMKEEMVCTFMRADRFKKFFFKKNKG